MTFSEEELDKYYIIKQVQEPTITQAEVGELLKRLKQEGADDLKSKHRGGNILNNRFFDSFKRSTMINELMDEIVINRKGSVTHRVHTPYPKKNLKPWEWSALVGNTSLSNHKSGHF